MSDRHFNNSVDSKVFPCEVAMIFALPQSEIVSASEYVDKAIYQNGMLVVNAYAWMQGCEALAIVEVACNRGYLRRQR